MDPLPWQSDLEPAQGLGKGPFKSAGSHDSEREGWTECFDRLERYVEKL